MLDEQHWTPDERQMINDLYAHDQRQTLVRVMKALIVAMGPDKRELSLRELTLIDTINRKTGDGEPD